MNHISKKALSMCTAMVCAVVFAAIPTVYSVAQTTQTGEQRTTLYVNVAVERQEVVAGPYARYAQKYLGVAAPLADKVSYEVKSVKLLDVSDLSFLVERFTNSRMSHMNPGKGFPRLTVDKTSAAALSLEESARTAAATIFEIRKSRLDLITGDVGENVFGGGLASALAELDRLEDEYLSLFFGRQSSQTDLKQYRVTPVKDVMTYIVCRFSAADGLLPQDDMSGMPVVLEMKPVGTVTTEGLNVQVKPSSKTVSQFIPADMQCRIILDGKELASERFTIRQLGETIYVKP